MAFMVIQSRSPRSRLTSWLGSALRISAVTVEVSPSLISRVLGLGGSSSRFLQDFVERLFLPPTGIKGRAPRKKFVQDHTQGIDVRARIHIAQARVCLLGAHITGSAHGGSVSC